MAKEVALAGWWAQYRLTNKKGQTSHGFIIGWNHESSNAEMLVLTPLIARRESDGEEFFSCAMDDVKVLPRSCIISEGPVVLTQNVAAADLEPALAEVKHKLPNPGPLGNTIFGGNAVDDIGMKDG